MRDYPRFLFSNPKNTKSKGPFIIHCLPPRLIIKITPHGTSQPSVFTINSTTRVGHDLEIVDVWEKTEVSNSELLNVLSAAEKWLHSQYLSKSIEL